MKKIKTMALITVILGGLSLACLFLVMLALQDIYHGGELSLLAEWNMVRIGFIIFWIFHGIALLSGVFVLRMKTKAS